ncbi:MAG TPA: hypothetical protein VEV19_09025 [Ktedonobacteraceae bacterium]|nr:hypothetical protein [Ktedonobacteraceae bacterium]
MMDLFPVLLRWVHLELLRTSAVGAALVGDHQGPYPDPEAIRMRAGDGERRPFG